MRHANSGRRGASSASRRGDGLRGHCVTTAAAAVPPGRNPARAEARAILAEPRSHHHQASKAHGPRRTDVFRCSERADFELRAIRRYVAALACRRPTVDAHLSGWLGGGEAGMERTESTPTRPRGSSLTCRSRGHRLTRLALPTDASGRSPTSRSSTRSTVPWSAAGWRGCWRNTWRFASPRHGCASVVAAIDEGPLKTAQIVAAGRRRPVPKPEDAWRCRAAVRRHGRRQSPRVREGHATDRDGRRRAARAGGAPRARLDLLRRELQIRAGQRTLAVRGDRRIRERRRAPSHEGCFARVHVQERPRVHDPVNSNCGASRRSRSSRARRTAEHCVPARARKSPQVRRPRSSSASAGSGRSSVVFAMPSAHMLRRCTRSATSGVDASEVGAG